MNNWVERIYGFDVSYYIPVCCNWIVCQLKMNFLYESEAFGVKVVECTWFDYIFFLFIHSYYKDCFHVNSFGCSLFSREIFPWITWNTYYTHNRLVLSFGHSACLHGTGSLSRGPGLKPYYWQVEYSLLCSFLLPLEVRFSLYT